GVRQLSLLLRLGVTALALFSTAVVLGVAQPDMRMRLAGVVAGEANSVPIPASGSPLGLERRDVEHVLSYVDQHRDDDPLIEVRPGVMAKRSNVQGVQVNGRTVYYDLVSHQSFGPLRSGKVKEAEVDILARDGMGSFAVVVYSLRR
ncbi:MAG TPA: hypothetical protein VHS99_23215, partial [Chloroflexota bacterium]|nr:hypothetical protein [Chloroflexota bacterium]